MTGYCGLSTSLFKRYCKLNSTVSERHHGEHDKRLHTVPVDEPFCLPVIQHVPIRQRLSSVGHRGSSADISSEMDPGLVITSNPYLYRRRRMSLLQTLRYQNRMLADSGVECRSQQSDGDNDATKAHQSSYSPPFSASEPKDSRRSSSIIKLKNKTFAFFGKRSSKRSQIGNDRISNDQSTKYCQGNENDQPIYSSIDLSAKEARHGKSPSTNDSGHDSQGRIVSDEEHHIDNICKRCSKQEETVAVIEQPTEIHSGTILKVDQQHRESNLIRSLSCPQLGLNLRIYHEICRRAMSNRQEFLLMDEMDSEEDTEISDIFMPITDNLFTTDKDEDVKTPTKSLESSSCEATECQHDSSNEELNSKIFPRQKQSQSVKKLRLSNGYVTGQFVYVSSRRERNSSRSRISMET
uniref:Uncharacterized protein n=1 Tax=Setaria digitata TaxID=48799 RepID=A0A915Q3V1_9BILA